LNTACFDLDIMSLFWPNRVCRKTRENVYFLIVESLIWFCICENPGLLNQSDTVVKVKTQHFA